MRTLVILFCFSFIINLRTYTQVNDSTDIIIDFIEQMPIFPGGFDSIWCFIESNFRYDIINADPQSIMYVVKFVIDSSGVARDFNIIATIPNIVINHHIDNLKRLEILRVLELMPNWEPARQLDKKISCWYTIPIRTPYTEFNCKQFKDKGNIEYRPDSLAQFKIGKGKTNQERVNNFLYNNVVWPTGYECTGRVSIKCIVEKSGQLTNFKFVQRLCPEFDMEALRIVKMMPNWHPALKNNKPVRSIVIIPILFRLQ